MTFLAQLVSIAGVLFGLLALNCAVALWQPVSSGDRGLVIIFIELAVPFFAALFWIGGRWAQIYEEAMGKACCWSSLGAVLSGTAAGLKFALGAGSSSVSAFILGMGTMHFVVSAGLIVASVVSARR